MSGISLKIRCKRSSLALFWVPTGTDSMESWMGCLHTVMPACHTDFETGTNLIWEVGLEIWRRLANQLYTFEHENRFNSTFYKAQVDQAEYPIKLRLHSPPLFSLAHSSQQLVSASYEGHPDCGWASEQPAAAAVGAESEVDQLLLKVVVALEDSEPCLTSW